MKKNEKIIIGVAFGLIVLTGIGVYWYNQRKKRSLNQNMNEITPEDLKETKDNLPTNQAYDPMPEINDLKNEISKAYYVMEIIGKDQSTNQLVNVTTGKTIDPGLLQGTWIQLKKKVKDIYKNFDLVSLPTQAKRYGETLIRGLEDKIDMIFDPNIYNTDQSWFQEYLNKGGKF